MVRRTLSHGQEGLSYGEENTTSWTGRAELCLAHVADTVQGVMERLLTDTHAYFFSSWMIKFPYRPGIRCGKSDCFVHWNGNRSDVHYFQAWPLQTSCEMVLEALPLLVDWLRPDQEPASSGPETLDVM